MLLLSLFIFIIGLIIGIVTFYYVHRNKKALTLKRVSVPILVCCIGCWMFAYHIYIKDSQRIVDLKKIVSTNINVRFYTEKDSIVRTIEGVSKDTTLVYSSGKTFDIRGIKLAN